MRKILGNSVRHGDVVRVDANRRRSQLDEAIALQQLGLGAWRVVDSRLGDEQPGHVLGFVEKHGGAFQLLQDGADRGGPSFESMRAALTHLVRTSRGK